MRRVSTGSFSGISRRVVCFQPGRREAPGLFSLEIPCPGEPDGDAAPRRENHRPRGPSRLRSRQR